MLCRPFLPLFPPCLVGLVALLFLSSRVAAHPIPDVPVRAAFDEGGACRIQVEVDPRCFDADPEIAPSLLHSALKAMPEAERAALLAQAGEFVKKTVEFRFEPSGVFTPEFAFEFTTHNAQPLTKEDDVVVMTGNWSGTVPTGAQGYRIHARPEGKLSVLFLNHLRGKEVARMMVLFPKETSFMLDLIGNSHELPPKPPADSEVSAAKDEAGEAPSGFFGFLKPGFLQVIPRGYEFILFLLAMFLLGRGFRALFPQLAAFVIAHSLALWMDVMGWLHVPATTAQTVAAAGILVLALANLVHPRCTLIRLVLVAVFGMFHGFNLAAAFARLEPPAEMRVPGLWGFLTGVELGLLAVVAAALLLTVWARSARVFRWAVAVPGSLAVAAFGLWTMANRMGWIGA